MRIVSLVAGIAVLSMGAGGSARPDAIEVARRVQQRYDETRDLSAEFTQEVRLAAGGHLVRSRGRMYFRKPGRMRWEYESPEPQTIVADGRYLWIHQPEDEQVLRSRLEEAFQSRTPVSFLLGVAHLTRDFEPQLLDPARDGALRLELRPKATDGGALGVLILEIDPQSYDLRAAMVKDPFGNVTEVRLLAPQRNRGVDDEKFHFVRPPGTDVIEVPGS